MNTQLRVEDLHQRWEALTDQEPKLRIRDAAKRLNSSEAALLATQLGSPAVRRLTCRGADMLPEFKSFGRVMCLTRNEAFVHERDGEFQHVEVEGPVGLVLGPDIDLRCFLHQWRHAFAVSKKAGGKELKSIQFFDAHGDAVFKVYLRESSDVAAYDAFVEKYLAEEQTCEFTTDSGPAPSAPKPDSEIDVESFQAAWMGMQDTHEFFGILRKHGVARTQALRLAPKGHADKLEQGAFQRCLEASAETETPIMVFVGSPGCIQIHSGPVAKLKMLGDWFNVLDPMFNLHANLTHVAETWRVRKPTDDGIVTSIEVFDDAGQTLCMLFGERKPGKPELPAWRELVERL